MKLSKHYQSITFSSTVTESIMSVAPSKVVFFGSSKKFSLITTEITDRFEILKAITDSETNRK